MEKEVMYHIGPETALYLCKHFFQIDNEERIAIEKTSTSNAIEIQLRQIGSKFYPEFTKGPFELVSLLNTINPTAVFEQNNERIVSIFKFESPIGHNGIISLEDIGEENQNEVYTKQRNGIDVKVWRTSLKNDTNQLVLIRKEKNVITCFPGIYAPPLPTLKMTQSELKMAEDFWIEHVFIEYHA